MTAPYVPGDRPTAPGGAPQPPAPAPRRSGPIVAAVLVVGAVLVVVLVGLTVAVVRTSDSKPPTAARAGGDRLVQPETATPEPEPTSGPSPAAKDFELVPKIIEKKCFGSAGCNVTFRVDVNYGGPTLSEADTWLITYEVHGIEDAPGIGTLELTGTTFSSSEDLVSTTGPKKKITLKVTSVEKDGI